MSGPWLVLPGLVLWFIILFLPWRPWGTRESLDTENLIDDLSDITVLIPARNEEEFILTTLLGLKAQGSINKILLLDDESEDDTVLNASSLGLQNLEIIHVDPLPRNGVVSCGPLKRDASMSIPIIYYSWTLILNYYLER